MLSDIAIGRANALLKQRNMLVVTTLALLVLVLLQTLALFNRDREIVLQPILAKPLTITSSQLDGDYLEMVTRDTALVLLNRSPDNLSYWQEQVLRITSPTARGDVKRQLVKIVDEMRNSDLTQAFVMTGMRVNPKTLTSEVDGIVTTYAGSKVISRNNRTYEFEWKYEGLSLSLAGFEIMADSKQGGKK